VPGLEHRDTAGELLDLLLELGDARHVHVNDDRTVLYLLGEALAETGLAGGELLIEPFLRGRELFVEPFLDLIDLGSETAFTPVIRSLCSVDRP
jgi:hypothetical protein